MFNEKFSNIFLILFRYKLDAVSLTAFGSSISIWHSFNHISVVGEEHDGHSWHLCKYFSKAVNITGNSYK